MRKIFFRLADPFPAPLSYNIAMLLFRTAASLELMVVHGFKKLGVGTAEAENIPNPLHLPDAFNNVFAVSANILFPVFILLGFCTRLATLPVLAVTLTGYFVLHWNDAPLVRDTPGIYSLVFLLILVLGPGKYSIDHYICKRSMR